MAGVNAEVIEFRPQVKCGLRMCGYYHGLYAVADAGKTIT